MIDLTAIESRSFAWDGNYADGWEPVRGERPWGFFRGPDGRAYDYGRIAYWIRQLHNDVIGRPILEQLEAVGLREIYDQGTTPCALPITFR
jgi:hypothetical protein